MCRKWKMVSALSMAVLIGCLMPMGTMLAAEENAEAAQVVNADSVSGDDMNDDDENITNDGGEDTLDNDENMPDDGSEGAPDEGGEGVPDNGNEGIPDNGNEGIPGGDNENNTDNGNDGGEVKPGEDGISESGAIHWNRVSNTSWAEDHGR